MASLVTLADCKTALGISGSDNDTYLQRQLDLVSERARGYTNRYLTSATFEETWFAPSMVQVKEYPVVSLTTVTADDVSITVGNLRVDKNRGRIFRSADQSTLDWMGVNKLVVRYVGGYATLPTSIAEWVYIAVKAGYDALGTDGGFAPGGSLIRKLDFPDAGSVEFQTQGVNSINLPDWLARVPMSALDPWRDPSAAMSDEYIIYEAI